MDLDLDHYELDDLLALFKLRPNFTPEEFKAAKRIVLAVHPDKSGLGSEYFVFFSKAYKLLDYVNKTKHSVAHTYEPKADSVKGTLARQFTESEDFLSKFNTLFERHYVPTDDERRGHGDWLKSSADLDSSFEARKRESRALVAQVEPVGASVRAASLDGETYVDLKRSYTVDTVIGVSEEDLQTRPTLEKLKQERATPLAPLSRAEAEKEFLARAESESVADTRRAFKLVKQDQAFKRQNFWALLAPAT
jgi:hypothetical protein